LLGLLVATAVLDVNRLFGSPMSGLACSVAVLVMLRLGMMARRTALFCV
jgi:hypothetical protein